MHLYMEVILRTVSALLILLLIAKWHGKQTVSNMTFHDFATAITMGAIAANLAFNEKVPVKYLILCLFILSLTSVGLSWLSLKSTTARKWIAGSPTVVIEHGKILDDNLRKLKFTLDSLNQSLRQKDIFDISEVDYAILETNGRLSVKKKEEYLNVTRKDLKLRSSKSTFPVELIMDGKILEKNVSENGISKDWLLSHIRKKGKKIEDVFYGVKSSNGKLYLDFYHDGIAAPVDKE